MPRKITDYRGLTESSRLKLLHAVQRRPGQGLKSLAAAADLHDPEQNHAARDRAAQASARGALLRRISPELEHGDHLGQDAQHQLDVLYEHLDDAGMEPVLDSTELTVGVRPCIYEDLLDDERPVVCSVHARLVRQQLDQVDGPLKLRRLHPFTTAHSCLLVLGTDDAEPTEQLGIDANRTDAELADFALQAQQRAKAQEQHTAC